MGFYSSEKSLQGERLERPIEAKIAPIIKEELRKVFDSYPTGQERIDDFLARLTKLLTLAEVDLTIVATVSADLHACAAIEDKEEFVEQAYGAVKPILQPEMFEKIEQKEREHFGQDKGFVPLNEILFYEVDAGGASVHLHWAPSRTIPWEQKMALLLSGMQRLAKIVQDDEKIKTVYAASWIVAKWPDLLTQSGFTLDGPINEADREKYFADQPGDIHTAHIDRAELLSRYS